MALLWVIMNMETAALIFRAQITDKWKTAFSLAHLQPVCLHLAPICCVAVLPMMIQLHSVLTPLVRLLCGQLTIWRKHGHIVKVLAHETVGNGACSPSGYWALCATWRACVHILRCRSTGKFSQGQQSLYGNWWYGATYKFSRTCSLNMCMHIVRSTYTKFSQWQ